MLRRRKITHHRFAVAFGAAPSNLSRGRRNPYRQYLPAVASLGLERYRYALNQLSEEEFGTCHLTDLVAFENLEPSEWISEGDGTGVSGVIWNLRSVLAQRRIRFKDLAEVVDVAPSTMVRLGGADRLPVIGSNEIEKLLKGITQLSEEHETCHPTELIGVMNGRYPEEILKTDEKIKNGTK